MKYVIWREICQWRRFGGFYVNFEHISQLCSSVSITNFEHVIAGWVFSLGIVSFP